MQLLHCTLGRQSSALTDRDWTFSLKLPKLPGALLVLLNSQPLVCFVASSSSEAACLRTVDAHRFSRHVLLRFQSDSHSVQFFFRHLHTIYVTLAHLLDRIRFTIRSERRTSAYGKFDCFACLRVQLLRGYWICRLPVALPAKPLLFY